MKMQNTRITKKQYLQHIIMVNKKGIMKIHKKKNQNNLKTINL
jgi:hypothetical protein